MKGNSIQQEFGRLPAAKLISKFGMIALISSSSIAYAQTQTCFDYTGAIETWQVPAGVTTVTAEAWGAEGGDSNWSTLRAGGLGAYVKGDVTVTPGDQLKILVGGAGETGPSGAGAGGSYLATSVDAPLLVAGGGGGASSDQDGLGGVIVEAGTADSVGAVTGGVGGAGGNVCGIDNNDGGGGGGFFSDGVDANSGAVNANGGFGGTAFVNGGTIAPQGRTDGACVGTAGGFGGGGSATCNTVGGGGGGGYSGGAGGQHLNSCITAPRAGGGGGGSFNSGINQTNTAAVRSGNGRVCVTPGAAVATYSVGGTVSGLTGAGLELQNNGGDALSVAALATNFTFATELADAADYAVTVSTQPVGQTCTVAGGDNSDGTGSIAGADVSSIAVDCVDDTVDPPAPSPAAPIPTMSAYGLALTTLGLLLVATRRLRASAKRS